MAMPFILLVGAIPDGLQHQPRAANTAGWHICRAAVLDRITRAGVVTANDTFWRSLTALSATLWLVMNLPASAAISFCLLRAYSTPAYRANPVNVALSLFFWMRRRRTSSRANAAFAFHCSPPNGYRSAMLTGPLFTRVLMRYQANTTTLDIKLYQGDFHL